MILSFYRRNRRVILALSSFLGMLCLCSLTTLGSLYLGDVGDKVTPFDNWRVLMALIGGIFALCFFIGSIPAAVFAYEETRNHDY